MAVDTTKLSGGMGSVPPPNAPREVTLPGSEQPTAEQVARARANERELAPLAWGPLAAAGAPPSTTGVQEAPAQRVVVAARTAPEPAAAPLPAGTILDPTGTPMRRMGLRIPGRGPAPSVSIPVEAVAQEATSAPDLTPATAGTVLEPAAAESVSAIATAEPAASISTHASTPADPFPIQPHMRAASNSDSPSRGMPTAAADPGKRVTGGFGDLGEAQYFPLDGVELQVVIDGLLASLRDRIKNDLRFSIAATYPRVTARVVIEVSCFAGDQSFQIEKKMVPAHEKTPMDVARAYGDEVVFCVIAQHEEMTDDGDSVTPPNKARLEHDLPVPRKQAVQLPGGLGHRMIVDV